jgi:hypothetical protein
MKVILNIFVILIMIMSFGCSKQTFKCPYYFGEGSVTVCRSCRSKNVMHTSCIDHGDKQCSGFYCDSCGSYDIHAVKGKLSY